MIWPAHNLKWCRQIVGAIRAIRDSVDAIPGHGAGGETRNPEVGEFSERASCAFQEVISRSMFVSPSSSSFLQNYALRSL